ncbi:nucleotidyltransferase family protein [Dyella sp.]|uniref:nucleotidyltransferase family protein n=1 Tax=Dyella sp. TaxID=1869338 RepID=UPI002ED1E27C
MTGIVLLAAGESRRFGSAKQMALIDDVPMLRHAAATACATGLQVLAVIGARDSDMLPLLDGLPLDIVRHVHWRDGLGASIAFGSAELLRRYRHVDGVMICLADQPRITTDDLLALQTRHRAHPAHIVTAHYAGARGAPCLFPRAEAGMLMGLSGDRGARALLRTHPRVIEVAMPHAALDVDTPQDLPGQHRPTM